jgi:hypothetical protein
VRTEVKFQKDGFTRTANTPGDAIALHNDGWIEVEESIEEPTTASRTAPEKVANTSIVSTDEVQ